MVVHAVNHRDRDGARREGGGGGGGGGFIGGVVSTLCLA